MSNKLKNKQFKQIQNQAQEGRSMVEMLGVLAIIGVLSIGGIAGYRWGMDKHISNQILNEMNLNSLQLAMLLQKGNPDGVTLSLGSPYDDENPTFQTVNYGFQYGCGDNAEVADPECEYINETRYFITALDLPERVQKMVAESAENLQYVTKVETDETDGFVTVFFDVDAGVTEYESRPEEPETSEHIYTPEVTEPTTTTTTEATTPETTTTEATTTTQATTTTTQQTNCPTGTTWNDTEKECTCSDGKHLYGNQCVTCDSSTGGTWDEENKECKCNDENKYWSDSAGKCIENPCNNGTGCDADEFCLSTGCRECSCPEGMTCNSSYKKTIEESGCTYKCEKIDSYKADNLDSEHPDRYVMSKSGKTMNWWSAERFCKALPGNRHMLTIADLNCKNTSLGGTTTGWCYAKDGSGSELSDVIKALRKAENGSETRGNYYYWLYDPYTSTAAGRNSCYAYIVLLTIGDVGDTSRRYDSLSTGGVYALCE